MNKLLKLMLKNVLIDFLDWYKKADDDPWMDNEDMADAYLDEKERGKEKE